MIYIAGDTLPTHIRALTGNGTVRAHALGNDEGVTITSQAWQDGSRDLWHVAALDTPEVKPVEDARPWPHNMGDLGRTPIAPRMCLVRTGTFCGKPATPVIYARMDDISPMIAAPAPNLSPEQAAVLKAIASLNSSGRKRFRDDKRMSDKTWSIICRELAALDLVTVNARGAAAITIAGRNVAGSIRDNVMW